ncbi:transmembrane amino acid transporter protein-domain-containing protein [Powellomyces hirtus]|nr:transmembrane amino acid transporter protein-domain-containing protein [Powellomyces hirtus]
MSSPSETKPQPRPPPVRTSNPRRRSTCVLLSTPEEYDDQNEDVTSFGGRANADSEPLGSWSSVVGGVLRDASMVDADEEGSDAGSLVDDEQVGSVNGRQPSRIALEINGIVDGYPSESSPGSSLFRGRFGVNGVPIEGDSDEEDAESLADVASERTPLLRNKAPIPTSTQRHTVMNSINLLMGMGVLTLPFAMSLCGWVVGISLLLIFPLLASTTAKLFMQCMEVRETTLPILAPPSTSATKSMSYGDTAQTAFGPRGKTFVSALYLVELFAACTALVILIADSVHALYPSYALPTIKCIVAVCLLGTTLFKTVKMLTYASFVGVVAIINLVIIVLVDGLSVDRAPGSLWDPAVTEMWPRSWQNVALAVGIMFVGFDGHAVFPTIYRDLKTPTDFPKAINVTYVIVTTLYLLIAVCGYLMFGNAILPEITQNLPTIPGYNPALTHITLYLVALNPFAKYALCLRPVHTVLEHHATNRLHHIAIRTALTGAVLLTTLLIPSFDRIMGLLGSLFSGSVAVIVPCACYAKLFWRGVGVGRKMMVVIGLAAGVAIVTVGGVGVLLGGSQ